MDIDLVDLIIARLQQDRDVERGARDTLSDGYLVSKIWQQDHETIDLVSMRTEEVAIKRRIFARLDRTVLRRVCRQSLYRDSELFKLGYRLFARGERGGPVKKEPA